MGITRPERGDRLPPASSEERTNLEDNLNNGRSILINLLQQRVTLLNEEIESLNVRIGPNPVCSPDHPEIESLGNELLKKERERRQHEEQLKPLRRWQMRREIGSNFLRFVGQTWRGARDNWSIR